MLKAAMQMKPSLLQARHRLPRQNRMQNQLQQARTGHFNQMFCFSLSNARSVAIPRMIQCCSGRTSILRQLRSRLRPRPHLAWRLPRR